MVDTSVDNFSREQRLAEQRARGKALQARIVAADLDDQDVAKRAGFRPDRASALLNGNRIAPWDFFERMDAALDELTAEAAA